MINQNYLFYIFVTNTDSTVWKCIWVQHWGYMLQKNRIGRQVELLIFFFTFLSLLFFYGIQRAYETLKQNLVKLKHSWTKKLNHLGQINWHRKCKSDLLVKKYSFMTFCGFYAKKKLHLFFVMEFLEIFYINFDIYFFIFLA